jgi:hypothetical protein
MPGRTARVRCSDGGGFAAEEVCVPRLRRLARAERVALPLSLFASLRRAGLPPPLTMQPSRALAPMRDLRRDEAGRPVRPAAFLCTHLTGCGQRDVRSDRGAARSAPPSSGAAGSPASARRARGRDGIVLAP